MLEIRANIFALNWIAHNGNTAGMSDLFLILDELKVKLEEYIERFGGKVRLIRARERQGLIRAKLLGAKKAIGDVLVFLDSHCEVTEGW